MPNPEIEKILNKYKKKLKSEVSFEAIEIPSNKDISREYELFKQEALTKNLSFYEAMCNFAEGLIKINPGTKKEKKLQESIDVTHLNITPKGAASFATLFAVFIILIGILTGILSYLMDPESVIVILPLLLVLVGVLIIGPLTNYPNYKATRWRLRASNQMVLCMLYIVMYMRHTSNLEHAIKFASEHVKEPLSLDLKKIFWNVETGKYTTIKESLDRYLDSWRRYNLEFVNSFHLIESSLYEPSEGRRLELLDKGLEVILTGTYEKMMHYTRELSNPITMLHMLGIVLPILGLVIFPLIGSFMGGSIRWYHVAILYNLLIPILVFSLGNTILSKRPTGYGEELTEFKRAKGSPFLAFFIIAIFTVIGLSPFIIHYTNPLAQDIVLGPLGKLLDFHGTNGPFGVGSLLLSFAIPLGIALGLGIHYKLKTNKLIKKRNETKKLETEFSASLFQLGNRIADGIPAEVAFNKVAKVMEGTPTGDFFSIVSSNIVNLGMSIQEAIFNKKNGAIISFPSGIIKSSMEILVESSRKGPKVVASSLISISTHVDSIHKVNERIKDLLAEIISSMKSQINFMAPVIAGIVIGIASMIVTVIGKLGTLMTQQAGAGQESQFGNIASIATLFKISDTIPPYFFQIIVGIYVVEIVVILTIMSNGIENGVDKLNEKHLMGVNLHRSILIYFLVGLITSLLFNVLANSIIQGISL